MKTVFKKGMEVYDKVNYPNKKGKVVDTEPACDEDDYPIEVEFEDNYSSATYTLDGRLDIEQIPTLSTKPYEIKLEGFEQKAPATTYEKAIEWLEKNSKEAVIYADEAYINEEYERAFEAFRKLIILRDYYNKCYNFEWLKNEYRAIIVEKTEDVYEVVIKYIKNEQHVLFFKSKEIAEKFLEEQKELLEIAKPLL